MAVQKYGLDLGTGTIKIYKDGQGTLLKGKNRIAIRRKTELVAFGDAAYEIYERCPENIRIDCPVKNGVIGSLHDMQIILDMFLKRLNVPMVSSKAMFFILPCLHRLQKWRSGLFSIWLSDPNFVQKIYIS